ncbi:MAG: metalloregulator ArsR/SmtB family transcription factor [Verrucomicrobiota bacterium JB023]|nr:metalloregulator ArsR/SmtB family transcription factor [Verrucomicrobiota bacterium JB023]
MNHENAVASLAELGNNHRLAAFRLLVQSGAEGATVGEIQEHLNLPASTLSHHLSRMSHVGLISQERLGRRIVCRPNYSHFEDLIQYLRDECCQGLPQRKKDGVTCKGILDHC